MCSQLNNQSNGLNRSIVTNGKGNSDKMMIIPRHELSRSWRHHIIKEDGEDAEVK
jgi:hypothetical protein